eukprot:GILJ01001929.1.p1 GENE.GILJ01001929.1~~GILJ01001929.1.p1  ORF type:complete len:282 (-),score=69.40 GILJ01001929.1:147-947(-)
MADRKDKLKRTIKVSNISQEATEAFVLDFFSVCGPALACRLKGEEAVVEFKDESASRPALFFTQATMLDRQIKVEMSSMTIEEFAPEAKAPASAQESDEEEDVSQEHADQEEVAAEEEEHHADTNQEEDEEEQEAVHDEQEDAQAVNAEDEAQSSDEDEHTTRDAVPVAAPVLQQQQPSPVKAAPSPVKPAPTAVASPVKPAPVAPVAAAVATSTSATRVRVKEETLLAGRVPLPADDAFRTLSDLNVLLLAAFGFLLFLSVKSIF